MSLHDESRILVVDDVNSMRIQIKDLLNSFGFTQVETAASGAEALALLQGPTKFQMVMCDWHMAPTNGLELLKMIRVNSQLKATSFIMVTAESTKECVIEAIKAGVDDYLVKPLTKTQIETKVYTILLKKRGIS